jgi:hypothetical protein
MLPTDSDDADVRDLAPHGVIEDPYLLGAGSCRYRPAPRSPPCIRQPTRPITRVVQREGMYHSRRRSVLTRTSKALPIRHGAYQRRAIHRYLTANALRRSRAVQEVCRGLASGGIAIIVRARAGLMRCPRPGGRSSGYGPTASRRVLPAAVELWQAQGASHYRTCVPQKHTQTGGRRTWVGIVASVPFASNRSGRHWLMSSPALKEGG